MRVLGVQKNARLFFETCAACFACFDPFTLSFQAKYAKAREETLERLKTIATSKLTEDHIKVFGELFDDGDLLEGESDFPREGGDEEG